MARLREPKPSQCAGYRAVGSDQFDEFLVKAVAQATMRGPEFAARADGPGADATTRWALDADRIL
ncbi:MAG: hypothetical protein IZT58_15270 [Actinobacteria bacterium]|nr:hypothetical protein [Actinomycetota bacterium]